MTTELKPRVDGKTDLVFTRKDGKTANVGLTSEELMTLRDQLLYETNEMTLNDYQKKAKSTCEGNSYSFTYLSLEIYEELGEFFAKVAKMVRKDRLPVNFTREDLLNLSEDVRLELAKECGDGLWGIFVIMDYFGWTANEVASINVHKLEDRQKRGVIIGNGDNR